MAETSLDYTKLFATNLPQTAPRWEGFPTYNFVGGHNNPDEIPIDSLIESAARALRQEGRNLATNYLRLCYALPSEQHIAEGIAKLARVFHQEAGIP